MPRTDVPLQVTAAAFPLAGPREAAVAVVVGIRTPAPIGQGQASIGPERFSAGRMADYRFDLPIAALPSGPYLLTVDLAAPSNHDAKHQPLRRAVPFRVR